MELEKLLKFMEETHFINQIPSSQIPNINLYMDQVLTFMNENLDFYKRNENDKIFTKSMINNYVKNNLISKPENKKYFPQHIITLIYIFYMKQILSLDDIKSIFDIHNENKITPSNMANVYEAFLSIEKEQTSVLENEVTELCKTIYSNETYTNFSDNERFFIIVSLLASRANAYKVIIEKLIDLNNNKNL